MTALRSNAKALFAKYYPLWLAFLACLVASFIAGVSAMWITAVPICRAAIG